MLPLLKNKIVSKPSKMLTYAEYISLALYDPKNGYYMVEREKVGKKGDFITSSNVHDIYGRTMARWYARLVHKQGLHPHVCELGAGNGRFAQAFIKEWPRHSDKTLVYDIVETSPYHRKLQKEKVPTARQFTSMEEMQPFKGMVFSNEFFDALPVHVIENVAGVLHEVMIEWKDGGPAECTLPLENERIWTFIKNNNLQLVDGQRMEIPLVMEDMIHTIAQTVTEGIIVTVDYGYTNEEWKEPARRIGSLRGYHQHQLIENVLENPGKMDITSHIHFDALIKEGNKQKLQFVSKKRQDEFLLEAGVLQELQAHTDPNPFSEINRRNRAIRSLITPGGMSTFFHVIVQQKGYALLEEQFFEGKGF